jgi:RNA polymerase sigma-70 factor (ECF subfamily)
MGSRAQAEDLVQEAWLRWDSATRTRVIQEPLAYLYRIVRNLALDGRSASLRDGRLAVAASQTADDRLTQFAGPTPEGIALYKDELRQLLAAMDELPERTRVAFQMHRLGGYKLREIAAHLGVSLPLAHKLVVDGLEHCKSRLRWIEGRRE